MSSEPLRLALIGWGAINRTVATKLAADPVTIVAVGVRDASAARPDLPTGATLLTDPDDLAATKPDVVVEAAGRDSVEPWGRAALASGADFIVSSVSAFADSSLLESLGTVARNSRTQLQISSGALAGVDALAAAGAMGIDHVEHRMVKPPGAWKDTPAEAMSDLDNLSSPTILFQATADAAAAAFPKNANVAMTTALAGVGPARTTVTLVADPAATTNRHEITAFGAFGRLEVAISNNPLPHNPKSSAMAALSLVRTIRNRVNPIVL